MNTMTQIPDAAYAKLMPSDYTAKAKDVIRSFIKTVVLIDDDWPEMRDIASHINSGKVAKNSASPVDSSSILKAQKILVDSRSHHEEFFGASSVEAHEAESEAEFEDEEEQEQEQESENIAEIDAPASMGYGILNQNGQRLLGIQDHFIGNGLIFTGFKYTSQSKLLAATLAGRSDILILDWNFAGDNGSGAVEIIKKLRSDGQLRFVCIFTDQPDLLNVKAAIVSQAFNSNATISDQVDFAMENFVFTLRNKSIQGQESIHASSATSLYDDALEKIAEHYNGLLQLCMLEMSSKHRANMMKHLTRFSSNFDIALLAESAQKGSPIDMSTNLRSLLLDEWRSALESETDADKASMLSMGRKSYLSNLRKHVSKVTYDQFKSCLDAAGISSDPTQLFEAPRGSTERRFDTSVTAWLEAGALSNINFDGLSTSKNASKVTLAVLHSLTHPADANGQFNAPHKEEFYNDVVQLDALFQQQMTLPAEITQGTILKHSEHEYFICITPLCDTARLPEEYHAYTFLGATAMTGPNIFSKAPDYCIFVEENKPICLHVEVKRPHVFEIDHLNRKIGSAGARRIKARYRLLSSGRSTLKEGDESTGQAHFDISLEIVGQLRTDFFLMLTSAAASNASRVGVNRAEMIRYAKNS